MSVCEASSGQNITNTNDNNYYCMATLHKNMTLNGTILKQTT